jgi:hypothetical protein
MKSWGRIAAIGGCDGGTEVKESATNPHEAIIAANAAILIKRRMNLLLQG